MSATPAATPAPTNVFCERARDVVGTCVGFASRRQTVALRRLLPPSVLDLVERNAAA